MSTSRALMNAGLCAMCVVLSLSACEQAPDAGASAAQDTDMTPPPRPAPLSDQERTQVAALLVEGDVAYQSGQWQTACDTYNHALMIDPANEQARAGLDASLAQLDRAGVLKDVEKRGEVFGMMTLAEFDAGYQRSLQALESEQFELAKGAILQARATLLKGRVYLTVRDFESRDAKAAELIDAIDRVWELHVRSGG